MQRKPLCLLLVACVLISGVLVARPAALRAAPVPPSAPLRPSIVGGDPAQPGAWPWLVAIVSADEEDTYLGQFCGGSLIAPDWVLTAAHCLIDEQGNAVAPETVDVVLGRQELTSLAGERIRVAEIFVFPTYGYYNGDDGDAALLRLSTPSNRQTIRIAQPSDDTRLIAGALLTTVGWGNLSTYGINYPTNVHQVSVPVVSNELCGRSYYGGNLAPDQLCAGVFNVGGKDSCQGDSGGPIMLPDGAGDWLHVGIVSTGEGCGLPGFPGIYARTSAVFAWVQAHLADQPYTALALTGPNVAAPGEPLSYGLKVVNDGPAVLNNVVISDTLPSGATYVGSSDGGALVGDTVVWALPTLGAGEAVERTLTISATETIVNSDYRVQVGSQTANGIYAVRTVIDEPNLALALAGDSVVPLGAPISYTLSIINRGLGPTAGATGLVVTNTVPLDTEVVNVEGGVVSNGVITWNIESLDADTLITRTLLLQPTVPGLVLNTDYGLRADGGYLIHGASGPITNVEPLALNISASGPALALSSQPITYTITITNESSFVLRALTISATLPLDATFVRGSKDSTVANGIITWQRFRLNSEQSAAYTFAVIPERTLRLEEYAVSAVEPDYELLVVAVGERVVETRLNPLYLPLTTR